MITREEEEEEEGAVLDDWSYSRSICGMSIYKSRL
jgi:hypothetical protein